MTAGGYLCRDQCPICSAPLSASIPAVRSRPAAEALPFGTHGRFLAGYTNRRVFFTYHRCRECGGLYCPVCFTPEQLQGLYSHQEESMAEVPLAARHATQKAYFEILSRHAPLEGEYLEIGPDIGLFAGICADRGRFTRFHLFEPNREVHPAMADRLAGRDVHISAAPYHAGLLPKAGISTAILVHVLDHLVDPADLLASIHDDLAPRGVVMIVTHDQSSLLARLLGRRWPPFAMAHPQLFSPPSICRLLERCGFTVVASRKTVNYFPLTYLVRSAFTVLGLERLAPRFDHPFTVTIRLGNIATIARRRP